MPIEFNNKKYAVYEGDYHPAKLMEGNNVIFDASDNIYTGEELSINATYNDKLLRIGTGKIYGNTELKADYRAAYGKSIQEVHETASKNLFDPSLLTQTVAFTVDGDTITTSGSQYYYVLYNNTVCRQIFEIGTTYYIKCHCKIVSIPDGITLGSIAIGMSLFDRTRNMVIAGNYKETSDDEFVVGAEFDLSVYRAITEENFAEDSTLSLYLYNPGSYESAKYASVECSKIMISKVDDPYIPYMGQSSAQLPKMYRVKTTSDGNLTIGDQQYISDYVELRKVDNLTKAILLHYVYNYTMTGAEDNIYVSPAYGYYLDTRYQNPVMLSGLALKGICTHYQTISLIEEGVIFGRNNSAIYFCGSGFATENDFKSYLFGSSIIVILSICFNFDNAILAFVGLYLNLSAIAFSLLISAC